MKKLLLLLMLLPFFGNSQELVKNKVLDDWRDYSHSFRPDTANLMDVEGVRLTKAYYWLCEENQISDNIEFCFLGEAAIKTRDVGVDSYIEKLYDLSVTGDGTQTTEANQPYLTGNISPEDHKGILNPIGDSRSIDIPTITITGTYTVTKCFNSNGITEVTHTELTSGSISSISFTGKLYAYVVRSTSLSTAQKAAESAWLLTVYPEIQTKQIGTQYWQTSNFDSDTTAMDNVIANVTEAVNVEKVTNGGFDTDTDWIKGIGWTINTGAGVAEHTGTAGLIYLTNIATSGKWYKITFTIVSQSGGYFSLRLGKGLVGDILTVPNTYTQYIKSDGTSADFGIYAGGGTIGSIDNVSIEEVGWAGSQELYDGLITQGESVQAALEASAMWDNHSSDSSIGAIYGKLYNGYARSLIVTDIATNGSWGYHVSTEAELTTLAANGGYALKKEGTDYWTTTGGTNFTGFTALGSATRSDVDGTFTTLKNSSAYWCADSDKVLLLNHADNTATITVVDKKYGSSIRLVKD